MKAVSFPAGDGAAIGGEGNPWRRGAVMDPLPGLSAAGDDMRERLCRHLTNLAGCRSLKSIMLSLLRYRRGLHRAGNLIAGN